MKIDPKAIQWDEPAAVDPSSIKWDAESIQWDDGKNDLSARNDQFNESTGTLENIGNNLKRGWYGLKSTVAGLMAAEPMQRAADAEQTGDWVEAYDPAGNPVMASELGLFLPEDIQQQRIDATKALGKQAASDLAVSTAKNNAATAAIPMRPATQALTQAKTFGEGLDALMEDPLGVIGDLGVQSSVQMAPALAVTVLSRNPAFAALAAGSNSAAMEYGSGVVDYLAQAGVDTSNEAAVRAALESPDTVRKALDYASTRAGIVGGFDAASGGLASKVLIPGKGLVREGVNALVAQPALQAGLGAGGEASAQLATTGEVRPGEVLAEAAGEMFTAPIEAASFAAERRKSVTDRVFGGPGIQAGDVLGDVGNDSAPIKAEKGPMTPGGRGYTFDESGNIIEERTGLALPPPDPVAPVPGTGIGPAGPREGADPVDFIVDPEGGPSAPGDWRARAEARRARSGGPGMGPVVDGEPTMAPDDMAQAAFDTAMETAKSAMGRAPSKSSASALASRIAERFGVDPAALIERNRNPVRTQVSPAGGVQPEQQPEIGNEEAGQVGTDGQGQEGQGQALLTPSAAVAAPTAAVAPASPAVEPAPPAEVPRGRMFRQGNNAEAVQAPNGTWYTRRRVAGRWQPWQRRRSFDPSGAHGYSPYQPPSGNVRTPAGVIRVGDDRREAKPTGPRPPNDVIQVIAAAGGINREAARRAGVDPAMLQRRVGIRPLFPINGGMPLNGMRELLTSEGFFPPDDPNAPPTVSDDDAFEVFNRALQGERIVSPNRAAEEAAYQASQRSAGTAQAEAGQLTTEARTDDDERLAAEFLSRVESDPVASRIFGDFSAEEDAEAMAIVDLAERAMQIGATPAEVRQAYNAQGDAELARNLWELIRTKEIANGPDAREGQARDRNGDQAQPGGLEAARDAAQRQPAAGNEGASASRPVESVGQAESEEVTRLRGEVSRLRRELDTDSLTGVKSRSAYSRDNPKAKGVAFIDVIAFKGYNTKFTETGGDAVLQAFGRVMLEVAGEQAYRRGGDEFAILSSESPEHAREIAKRVFDAMAQERLLLVDKEGVEYEIAGIPFRTGIGATDAEATADSAARKLAGDRESNPNVQRRASDADVGRSGAVPGSDVRGQGGVPGRQEDRGLTNEPQSDDQAGGRDGQGASAAVERGEATVRGADPGRGERPAESAGAWNPGNDRGVRNDGLAQAGPERADAAPVAPRRNDDTPADPLALSDETAVTPPPAAPRPPPAERPASQSGLFGNVTAMDVDRLNYERAQSEARTDPSRAPRPPASDTVDIEQQIARETKTPPEGGVSVSGVDAAGRQRITPDIAANLKPGDVVVDEDGNEYRAHAARHDWLEAHPIKDGKAVVNADTRVTFLLTPEKASAYPERRNVPIYATGRNLDEAIGGRAAGAAAAQASKIEDFGEKIGGARKDTWRGFRDRLTEVSDDDIITEPLSKTWPQPDYQKMIDEGADSWTVGFIRSARDAIPRKPTKAWKQKAWAAQVKELRDFAMSLLDGSLSVAKVQAEIAKINSRSLKELISRIELYQLVGHSKSLAGVSFDEHYYSLYHGKENVRLWVVSKSVEATAFSNWPRELATGSTKDEMLQSFKERFASLDLGEKKQAAPAFDIYSMRGRDGYWIGKKVGRNHIDLAGPFKTVGEARAHRDANNAALTEKLEAAKQIPNERRETNEPRVGADMRNGQDVTPQMFGDAFGFRGVEFGNWVDQKKRQNDLNEAFDALMDMAAILGIPPRAISLNGQLGIAFGARGSGGVNPAAAHYEPTSVVINLTKKNGAGSLGHEWWHALDNYFSRMRGKGGAYATEALDVSLASRGSRFVVGDARVRKEMIEAFGKVVSAINSTAIRARSAKLDARRSKEYWTTGREMAARAFESYLITKLQDQNASNDYLANIVDEATWAAAEKLGFELDESYPYPTAGEIPAISAAFDRFFNTIETRETDDGKVEIRENQAQYSGHAAGVPAAVRESTPESGKPGLRRDVQPGTSVPVQLDIFDVAGSRPITLRERADLRRRFADVRTGELKSGIDRVTSLADAAHIFAPLRKHAVEQFMALVLDASGKPLRVIRHSIGTRDGAGVYAETIVPQIAGTQGAHSVVFAHNHPSGSIEESTADIAVTNRLVAALEGSGIGVMGHVIVAPGSKVARIIDDGGLSRKTEITTARRSGAVPVVESMQRKAARGEAKWVSDPRSAITIASEWGNHGVILLNTRHEVIGTIAMSSDEMSALRDSDSDGSPRARNLLAAIADANASAVIVVSQDEKAGKNVATMFDRTKSARVLDVLVDDGEAKKSLAGTVSGFYLPRFASNPVPGWEFAGTDTDAIAESVLQAEIAKARAEFGDAVTIEVMDSINDSPASDRTKRLYPGANGLTDGKSRVWIFRRGLQSLQALRTTLAHEIIGHIGVERVIGADWPAVMDAIKRIREGKLFASPAVVNAIRSAESRYPGADDLTFAREAVAIMAERGITGALWDRIVAAVRRYLRKVFGSLQWSESEVRDLLRRAGEAARKPAVMKGAKFEAAQVVFHGTPHTVDRFSLQKIGTGEGAQAYGWGIYFASSKDVADFYKKALEKREYDINDQAGIDASFWMQGVTRQQAIQNVENALADPPKSANKKVISDWESDLAYLKSDKPIPQVTKRHGNLYRVEVPEDSDLLDWDKPLSEQPEKVRSALERAGIVNFDENIGPSPAGVIRNLGWAKNVGSLRGEELYRRLIEREFTADKGATTEARKGSERAASEVLMAAGIPGLRYLDGTSRNNGEGSHNYVIWDEAAIGDPTMASNPDGAITDTPEFKRWFGDSKVVDADGKPLVVYHGTASSFEAFDPARRGETTDTSDSKLGFFFSSSTARANEAAVDAGYYGGGNVMPVYLSMKNPLVHSGPQGMPAQSATVIRRAIKAGNDGVIFKRGEIGGQDYVVFRPEQIKSVNNRGTFDPNDPNILASNPEQGPIERKMAEDARDGQPIDKLFRLPFHLFGLDSHGRLKPGTKLYDWLTRVVAEKMPAEDGAFGWAIPIIKSVRSGLIDRYGVPQDFVQRDERRESEVRSVLMHAARVASDLEGLTTAEAKVLQAMLTGQEMPVGELGKLSQPIKEAIDQMGREAVELGLISPEAYERNRGAYLHRSYLKYEADRTPLGKAIGSFLDKRRKKLLGDTLRRRGMTMERDTGALAAALGGAVREGDTVTVLRQKTEAGGVRTKYQRGPLNGPAPVGWENLGDWRVMGFDGKKAKLWRDFTPAEREKMGEILDARYNITKTFALMAHDLATGRFLRDIAANPDWARADLPEGATAAEARGRYDTYADSEWVRVPDTAIPGTNDGKGNPVKRWGELAGMYVRAPIWRDLNQLREMQNPQVWGSVWNKVLTFWKTNKTARNPVVHVNNVMSNMMFMDLADIRLRDLYRAIGAWRNGEADDDYRDAMAHGAFGGGFADQELKRKVLQPILDDILAKQKTDGQDTAEDRLGVLHLLSTIWDGIKKVDGKMLDAYNAEDEIFRLAFYLRRQSLGDTPEEAARAARRQFIDYDIRAPWVNAARNTVLPFIGYTYRSIPILAQAIAERPWKLAKYATLAAAANWLGYLFAPGDEDDERKVMSPAVQGNTWTGTPRMIRMPWYDADGNPVFLDVRRWIPAGDVFDMNQSEISLPAWLQFGGPLQIAGELMLNKQAFTKQPIVDPLTDTPAEKAGKVVSWLWKGLAPNAPWIPESYSWDKLEQAATGQTDVMGRDFSAIEAASSTLGIKAAGHDVDLQRRYRIREFDKVERELDFDKAMLKRELSTKAITRERFDANMARIIEKEKRLNEKRREVLAR